MANKIGRLHADLSANSASFERDMKKARNATQNAASGMKRSMATAGKAFTRVAKSLISFRSTAVLAAGAVGLGLLVRKAIDAADKIGKTADKIGIGVEALQELRFAAERAGVGSNTLDLSLQRLARRLGEASEGAGVIKKTLDKYNIAIFDAEGRTRSTVAVLNDLADAIQNAGSENEQLLIAFKAFDSEGAAFVNALKKGSAGLNKSRAEARAFGAVLSEELVRKAEKASDKLTIMGKVLSTNATILALEFMPVLQDLATLLTDPAFLESLKKIVKEFKGMITFGGTALNFMAEGIAILSAPFRGNEFVQISKEIRKLSKEFESLAEREKVAAQGLTRALGPALEITRKRMAVITKELTELRARRLEILGQLPTPTGTPTGIPSEAKPKPATTKPKEQIAGVFSPLAGAIDDAALERIEVDLARALQKAQGRFRVFGNQTKLAEERLAAFDRAIDSLIEAGALERSPELIEKLRVQIDVLRFSLEKTGDKTEEVFEGMTKEAKILERVFEGVFDSIDKALDSTVEGVLLGTRSMSSAFADLAQNVGLAIQKMIIDIAVLDPLRNAIKGAGGIPGICSLLGNFIAGFFGAPSIAALPVAPPSALRLSGISVPTAAHGGVFTAPTLALIGEAGPEAVIPLEEMRSPDPSVNITIIDNNSSRVEVTQRQGPGGIPEIILTINKAVAKDIMNGGDVANAITQVFGANRQGAIR